MVSLPSIFLFAFDKDPSLGARDVVGIVMFVIGLVIEAVADQQKFNYKNSEKKENWADTGLWRISRHPVMIKKKTLYYSIIYLFVWI